MTKLPEGWLPVEISWGTYAETLASDLRAPYQVKSV